MQGSEGNVHWKEKKTAEKNLKAYTTILIDIAYKKNLICK